VKTEVLLVNFGGPRTLDEVPFFLRNLFSKEVSKPMEEAAVARYRAIGGGSPLAEITGRQAELLQKRAPAETSIRAAFRYSSPMIEEALNDCYKSGVERVILFAMSPFYSARTTGSYASAVERYLTLLSYHPEFVFVHSWFRERLFVKSWVNRIKEEMPDEDAFYLFSAHSLPLPSKDEPYKSQIEETVEMVAKGVDLAKGRYALAWQSVPRDAQEPWIEPTVEDLIDAIASKEHHIVQVPIGFITDHLETLYDIDIVHRRYAENKGLSFSRITSLNTYPPFIDALWAILEQHLGGIV
jgi:protoporphyrin/coproporphyrin ferrochelatase